MSRLRQLFVSDGVNRKNGMIEFLRFVFCVAVVLLHSGVLFSEQSKPLKYGSYAVEFFFIVSGYLMIKSIKKAESAELKTSLGRETCAFLRHKFCPLMPYLILVFIYGLIIHYIFIRDSLEYTDTYAYFITSLGELLGLRMTGLKVQVLNGNIWYISAMLIAMLPLYPLARKLGDRFTHIIAPFTAVMLIGWISRCDAKLETPGAWTSLGHIGTVRAFAALCLGCAVFAVVEAVKERPYKRWFRATMTVVEWVGYAVVIATMQIAGKKSVQMMMIYLTAALVALTFSGITYSQRFMSGKLVYALGKFSLPLYIFHYIMRYTLQYLKLDLPTEQQFAIYIGGALAVSALSEAMIRFLRVFYTKHPLRVTDISAQ